jgi:hypothetical protein
MAVLGVAGLVGLVGAVLMLSIGGATHCAGD